MKQSSEENEPTRNKVPLGQSQFADAILDQINETPVETGIGYGDAIRIVDYGLGITRQQSRDGKS
ncbi:MAG: hypothetical protein ABI443_10685 [Chthoniobacterales bacterium]